MSRLSILVALTAVIYLSFYYQGFAGTDKESSIVTYLSADTVPANQFLYNGRIWRNKYFYIKGDPYLFATTMLEGSVVVNGKSFKNIKLQYDIYTDELLSLNNHNVIIQLNKEMVDEFTISFGGVDHYFKRIKDEDQGPPGGYVNILYQGKTSLMVKYFKTIELRAVENKFDSFSQSHKIYVISNGRSIFIRNKKQLMDFFEDKKRDVKSFIRENKLKLSGQQPESFVPAIQYYDRLTEGNNQ